MTETDSYMRRAIAAYYRSEAHPQQPSTPLGAVEEHEERLYVVLRKPGAILAVYRIRPDGILKRLRRWPPAIAADP